jgi:hypothetical protein
MIIINYCHSKNGLLALAVVAVLLFAIGCKEDAGKAKPPEQAALDTAALDTIAIKDSVNTKITSLDTTTINWDMPTIKDLSNLLGKSIDSLPEIKKLKKKKKERIVDEETGDDDINWFAVEYLYQNKLQMTVESNWVDKNIVNRISLYSNEIIEGVEGVYVGQTFGNVRSLMKNYHSYPDGYLFLRFNKYPKISIELDISHEPYGTPLFFGEVSNEDIPDSLKIISIVIMKRD